MKYRLIELPAIPDGSGLSACERCCFTHEDHNCMNNVRCIPSERDDRRNLYFQLVPVEVP